jgi:glycosyltransferase involved in cell wall biosynthesis
MKIGIVAPSAVPFVIGGAENAWWALQHHINQSTSHQAELIKLPAPDLSFWDIVASYRRFAELDVSHFDLVISTKYPAWMVSHPNHICYLQHRLRGLYDTYHFCGQPLTVDCEHPEVASLRRFMQLHWEDRAALTEWFERMSCLKNRTDVPAELFRFPGPFIREVVHFMDDIALSPKAIRRFAAISRNLTRRADYFPAGSDVDIIYHPSNLKEYKKGKDEYLFTVCRLDNAKRVHLMIDAMKHVRAPIELRIVGTGPDEERLGEQAKGDDRIKFLGFVTDREVTNLYADALAVLYIPYDEDYGLVTIEAMRSGKPVLTATDSGGPLEFVNDGETGFVVEPKAEALAAKIDYLCEHREHARRMGLAGEQAVAHITWEYAVGRLLDPPQAAASVIPVRSGRKREKITVGINFPVYPPRGGGQSRVFHLYRHLARYFDIELVSLAGDDGSPFCGEIAPGLREIRVPRSKEHRHAEAEIGRQVDWVPVTDVVLPELHHLTPEYSRALRESAATAGCVVASHPYLFPVIEAATARPIWYEAHNVESDLKGAILPPTPTGLRLLESVRRVEEDCCRRSSLIMVCCDRDGQRLRELYDADPEIIVEVPNGVDLEGVTFVGPDERRAAKMTLGIEGNFIALFMGSWHGPNLEAARQIFQFAQQLPDVSFLLLGSVGLAFAKETLPKNVGLMGVVDDATKDAILGVVDVALNPVVSGSGTNLKMLDYLAAGIPVISTPYGCRGLGLLDDSHVVLAEMAAFPAAIASVQCPIACLRPRISAARHHVEKRFSWGVIASEFRDYIERSTKRTNVRKVSKELCCAS